jgi:uncharacterized protein (DUF885 family)
VSVALYGLAHLLGAMARAMETAGDLVAPVDGLRDGTDVYTDLAREPVTVPADPDQCPNFVPPEWLEGEA